MRYTGTLNKITCYAADTKVFIRAYNVNGLIHKAGVIMNVIKNLLNSNKMTLDMKNTKCMIFQTKRTRIAINDVAISFHNEFTH